MAARGRSRTVLVVVVVALVAAAAFGVRVLWQSVSAHLTSDTCTIGSYQLDTDQASVAAQMVGAVTMYRPPLPGRAAVLALAAGLQESKLTDLSPGEGDRDSVGVLQQRPSQGWGGGHANRLLDVTEATHEFLAALAKVPHWQRRSLASAIQAVQVSADGSAYAQQEPEARALATAFLGKRPAGVTCDYPAPSQIAAARAVARMARDQLGITTPAAAAARVRVPGAGWQTAAWFVANADRLGIVRVAYDGRVFSRDGGWQRGPAGRGAVIATMAQRTSG